MASRSLRQLSRVLQQASKAATKAPAAVGVHSGRCLGQFGYLAVSSGLSSTQPATAWSASAGTSITWENHRLFRSLGVSLGSAEVVVPSMGESITEGTIAAILKQPGETVREDDVVAQIETDKVTIDVKYTGKNPAVVTDLLVNEQDTVKVGQLVAKVDESAENAAAAAPAPAAPASEVPKTEAPSAPAAAAATAPPPPPSPSPAQAAPPKAPAPSASPTPAMPAPGSRSERRVKMTRLRLRVAERLKGAQNTYAMLSTFNEIDMTNLMALRNDYKDIFFERHGVKLGFMSAFVKAAANALLEIPAVNAVIDGDEIVYRDYCDISIAVATPKGLVVPVLRNADALGFADVEKTINGLGKKARDGTISIDDMAGGTFTISNGGVYGSMLSTPIINPPQSAILGMHSIQKRAMVVGDKIEIRPMMYVALTYDHRLIDGREAVTFLRRIKEVVEDPRRLLLGV